MADRQSYVPAWYLISFNGILMFSASYLLWSKNRERKQIKTKQITRINDFFCSNESLELENFHFLLAFCSRAL